MKYIVLIPDGCADASGPDIEGSTSLERARTPNMDRLAREGMCGLQSPIPRGMSPGSEVGNLSVLGYDPEKYLKSSGRGPLEAAALGVSLEEDEWAMRMNLVHIDENGLMADHSAGHITTEESKPIIEKLAVGLEDFGKFKFSPGVGYRHLAVTTLPLAGIAFTPPHDIIGKSADDYRPRGTGAKLIGELMRKGHEVLSGSNNVKATDIWLWGAGKKLTFEPFAEKYGVSGGVVTAVDLLKGIGVLLGLQAPDVPGATGFTDTDYEAKVNAAFGILAANDFVYLHVEAPDEMGHAGDAEGKVAAIEAFDERVVGPVLGRIGESGGYRVLVTCDHLTPLDIRTHKAGALPFAVWGEGIDADGTSAFSERACLVREADQVKGHELMARFIEK